jgi:hypothetical protein
MRASPIENFCESCWGRVLYKEQPRTWYEFLVAKALRPWGNRRSRRLLFCLRWPQYAGTPHVNCSFAVTKKSLLSSISRSTTALFGCYSLLEVLNHLRNPPRVVAVSRRETPPAGCLSNYMSHHGMISYQQSKTLQETRHRTAELYLNGTCLVRSICCGSFQKVPFFLRHLWCALLK